MSIVDKFSLVGENRPGHRLQTWYRQGYGRWFG